MGSRGLVVHDLTLCSLFQTRKDLARENLAFASN